MTDRILRAFFGLWAFAALASAQTKDAPRRMIADFEGPDGAKAAEAVHGSAAVVPAGTPNPTQCVRWTIPAGRSFASLYFRALPTDLTPYRTLRMSLRAQPASPGRMSVRFQTTTDDFLGTEIAELPTAWGPFEVDIAKLRTHGRFDPKKVTALAFVFFDAKAGDVLLDDVELVTAPGGWKFSDKELIADLFGKERASKAKAIETADFKIYTVAGIVDRDARADAFHLSPHVRRGRRLVVPRGRRRLHREPLPEEEHRYGVRAPRPIPAVHAAPRTRIGARADAGRERRRNRSEVEGVVQEAAAPTPREVTSSSSEARSCAQSECATANR
jgi:hypothetical protein